MICRILHILRKPNSIIANNNNNNDNNNNNNNNSNDNNNIDNNTTTNNNYNHNHNRNNNNKTLITYLAKGKTDYHCKIKEIKETSTTSRVCTTVSNSPNPPCV